MTHRAFLETKAPGQHNYQALQTYRRSAQWRHQNTSSQTGNQFSKPLPESLRPSFLRLEELRPSRLRLGELRPSRLRLGELRPRDLRPEGGRLRRGKTQEAEGRRGKTQEAKAGEAGTQKEGEPSSSGGEPVQGLLGVGPTPGATRNSIQIGLATCGVH